MNHERERQPHPLTLEWVTRTAKETTLRDGGHVPMLLADGTLRTVVLQIAEYAPTHPERLAQMFVAGFEVAQQSETGMLTQVFFISEAWMSVGADDQPPQIPPSEDPARIEVLLIAHLQVAQRATAVNVFEMVRGDDGQLTDLRTLQLGEKQNAVANSSLLEAFADGFEIGMSKLN